MRDLFDEERQALEKYKIEITDIIANGGMWTPKEIERKIAKNNISCFRGMIQKAIIDLYKLGIISRRIYNEEIHTYLYYM